jgi:hypothetical protein
MDESAAVVAEPAHERAIHSRTLRAATARVAHASAPLPGLLDPRMVRAELSRMRGPHRMLARLSRDRGEPRFDVRGRA